MCVCYIQQIMVTGKSTLNKEILWSQGEVRAKEGGKSKHATEVKDHLYILDMSFTISLHRYLYRYDSEVKAHSNSSVS